MGALAIVGMGMPMDSAEGSKKMVLELVCVKKLLENREDDFCVMTGRGPPGKLEVEWLREMQGMIPIMLLGEHVRANKGQDRPLEEVTERLHHAPGYSLCSTHEEDIKKVHSCTLLQSVLG